jgi:organic radical activating enzyme
MADTFCPVPWNFQAIQNNGTVRVCCQMNMTKGRGTLFKDDGTAYNAKNDDLTSARNASLIKDVRKHMFEGKWHPDCKRCQQEESAGLNSRRNYEKTNWPDYTIDSVKNYTKIDGEINTDNFPLVYYDLRFGNLCNLACVMCGPEDSHTWYKDWADMYGSEWDDTHGKVILEKNSKGRWVTDSYNWHGSESFWNQLESNLHNIQMVYMAGGEPMMIERHYEFLQKCVSSEVAKNITLEYNTNLTNISQRAIDMWKYFKQVRLGASIDGYGKVLEYQRYPVKWNLIEKNLQIVDNLPDNVIAWIACTVTTANVFHVPDFMLWKLEQNFKKINNFKRKPIISHHVCHKPWSSCIRVLPDNIKKEIIEHYNKKKHKFKDFGQDIDQRATEILDSITNYMLAKDETEHLNSFIDFTKTLDKLRNQDITSIVPEYKELFK